MLDLIYVIRDGFYNEEITFCVFRDGKNHFYFIKTIPDKNDIERCVFLGEKIPPSFFDRLEYATELDKIETEKIKIELQSRINNNENII